MRGSKIGRHLPPVGGAYQCGAIISAWHCKWGSYRGAHAPSTYLSLSSFMGMPQQTNTPPPASTTFTLLPHTLQRYSCPTAVAMHVLLGGFQLLTPGTEAPERQRRMFNLEALQRLRW